MYGVGATFNTVVLPPCVFTHIYAPIEPHQPKAKIKLKSKSKSKSKAEKKEEWRMQTWLSFDSYSRFTLVCCQYVFIFIRWLFAGKHFLINYIVQSTIHTIRVQSVDRTLWVSVVHCHCRRYRRACRFQFFFVSFCSQCVRFNSIFFLSFTIVSMAGAVFFINAAVAVAAWYTGTRYLPFNVFVWWCAYK